MLTPRSALFVPADRHERHQKAFDSGAAAVIVDLEDAVAASQKDAARRVLVETLAGRDGETTCLVRINSPLLAEGEADLEALGSMRADGIVVPKADVASVKEAAGAGLPIVALVETAAGILDAAAIAAHPAVDVLMLGPVDLSLELGIEEAPDGDGLGTARGLLVLAAAAGGIPGPLDGPCVLPRDEAALASEIDRARRLGFAGKSCIHPAQVAPVNAAFAPTAAEIEWAGGVVAAYDEAGDAGVVMLDGEMIDLPVVLRARRILERA
jgi:citrate lyase subunit beta / citryl-CoA lyase